jgi:hypothetical protein
MNVLLRRLELERSLISAYQQKLVLMTGLKRHGVTLLRKYLLKPRREHSIG